MVLGEGSSRMILGAFVVVVLVSLLLVYAPLGGGVEATCAAAPGTSSPSSSHSSSPLLKPTDSLPRCNYPRSSGLMDTGVNTWPIMSKLLIIKQVAESLRFRYMLHAGLLLGAVRHGSLIPWDLDGDVFLQEGMRERLIPALRGYLKRNELDSLYEVRMKGSGNGQIVRKGCHMMHVDLCPLEIYPRGKNTLYRAGKLLMRVSNQTFWRGALSRACTCTLSGIEFTCPSLEDARHILTQRYGPKWSVVDPQATGYEPREGQLEEWRKCHDKKP